MSIEQNLNQMRKSFGNEETWKGAWNLGYGWGDEESVRKRITPLLDKYIPKRIDYLLEIACGYGRATRILRPYCRLLYGIDINENCVNYCRNQEDLRTCIFGVTDGISIPFRGMFDVIYSFDSLVHADTLVIEKYVEHISRRLFSGGLAIIHHACNGDQGRGNRSNTTKQEVASYVIDNGLLLLEQIDEQRLPSGAFNDTTTVMKKP